MYYGAGENEKDYICSQPDDNGMTKCSELPPYVYEGRRCNGSAVPFSNNTPSSSSDVCVNWNQYYSLCKPVGSNPFQGAISFDNIGLAWVAIFQVNMNILSLISIMYQFHLDIRTTNTERIYINQGLNGNDVKLIR